ncbi:MAG: homoserine O-acetyltransferase [Deltaproteobacteria bacterium]|jgi:homoserine O-acetyltransferase|nr:homoserine O-acetyltransferase [Deltaproteobacteria bacterium]
MSVDGETGGDVHKPDHPNSQGWTEARRVVLFSDAPLELEAGGRLSDVETEYETYGRLSKNKDNAVLVCHALTGDAHAAGWDKNPEGPMRAYRRDKPGWWDRMVGPGKAIDTDRFYVVCANVLGSCYGTLGPSSVNPATGRPWGMSFPIVTVGDWARQQIELLKTLGVGRLKCAVGGSMGGQIALEIALARPDMVEDLIILSAGHRVTSQGLAFSVVGRNAVLSDPYFCNGDYYGRPGKPLAGLAVARMMAQITYLSEESMGFKFGRKLRGKESPDFTLTGVDFELESYLNHQAESFVKRYDANSYLYLTRAMDYYDAADKWGGGDLAVMAGRIEARTMVVSFSSDWLFPPELCREMVTGMCLARRPISYVNVPSRYGHDAFLVETETVRRLVACHLKAGS